jgi:hypothetical protein
MAEPSILKTSLPSFPVIKKSHFSAIWLEIANLGAGMNEVNGNITKMDLVKLINHYFFLGIRIIVIGYSEFLGQFYYQSEITTSFTRYIVSTKGKYTSTTVIPKQAYCPLLTNGDHFFDVLFDTADQLGMRIIMGLGRTEDWYLMNDIYANLTNGNLWLPLDINRRLSDVVYHSKMIATELYALYGSRTSFYGWYLCHETQYHDVGANYYEPVGIHLKSLNPRHQVMVSPPAFYRNGFLAQSLTESLKNSNIDIVALQDVLGAGYLAITNKYYFTSAARSQRLLELQNTVYPQIKTAVENAGKTFWIMVEAWEMDGMCSIPGNYGDAYNGDFWSRIYFQLELALKNSTTVILNEGLMAFDFGIPSLRFKNSKRNDTSTRFTNDYKDYLGL